MSSLLIAQLQNEPVALGLFITGVVFISAWLLMRIRKRARNGPDHPTAREVLEQYKQRDGVRDDLQGLMVEIEQLAKRVGAQLDAKAMRVEQLIDDADLRIAQLQKAMQDQHATPPGSPPPGSSSDTSPAENALAPGSTAGSPNAGAGTDASLSPTSPAGSSAPASPTLSTDPADALAAEVGRLADEGLAPDAIARQLDEHVGKVELILALRQR